MSNFDENLYFLGDEVIEWNGRSLRDKTYEEVYDIIAESKQEPQVELIVSRPIRRPPGNHPPFFVEDSTEPRSRISRRFTDAIIPSYHQHHGMYAGLFLIIC